MTEVNDYYIGYDIGTNSVGWAVTDKEYNILRYKGKDLWGVRLFNEAETAADRRMYRSARRNNSRKKQRLQLLREIFEDEINKIDEDFYLRLEESKYWPEDKKVNGKYSLFNDLGYTDKNYFEKYPTIFHLRKDLMESDEKRDIRLYFLAINQMMKRRGHFLFENQKLRSVYDISPYTEKLSEIFINKYDVTLDQDVLASIIYAINDNTKNKTERKNLVKEIIDSQDIDNKIKSNIKSIINLGISGSGSIKFLIEDDDLLKQVIEDSKEKIDFNSDSYEEDVDYLKDILGEDVLIIEIMKALYEYSILQKILDDSKSISIAQVNRYNKHKEDLKRLKKLVKKYDEKKYNDIFKEPKYKYGYTQYIGHYKKGNKKYKLSKVSYEDFSKQLKKDLNSICDKNDEEFLKILDELENNNFLLKQISSRNTVIPYQLHLQELEKILENLVRDYPSFGKVKDGISRAEKIKEIFCFRIPYYVGPVNDAHKGKDNSNTWIVRNKGYENDKVRPWNFEEVVDLHGSEEEFIKRMTNTCTYLLEEKVIPKNSILYSKYMVLNELNNLKINGEKISVELKKKIYEDLFKKYKNMTVKKLKNYLVINNYENNINDITVTGIDTNFKSSMKPYIETNEILGNKYEINMVEDIIEMVTIHTGNKKLLREKISQKYSNLSEKEINKLVSLNYSDWGRLSRKFLTGLNGENIETGEINNIIGFLEETNNNLQMLLSNKFTFREKIDQLNIKELPNKLSYEMIDNLEISPSVKKMIWQVLRINDELISSIGYEPKKIFVEMARGKEENAGRTSSRKAQLISLYKSIKSEDRDWVKELENIEESKLRSKKLFLYYLQNGRCMYTGNNIDLDDLFDNNLYDIDHIIPKSKKKDDSIINNLVLVERNYNQSVKKDIYPIPCEIKTDKVLELWKYLYSKGFISKIKYERLIRKDKLKDEELAEFINRQLVETRQSTKILADILKKLYKHTGVVYVKAGLVSDFRYDFDILKCREINDLHHAHDAYLNIVVGNVYNSKFTSNPLYYIKENNRNYSMNNLFKKNTYDFITKEKVWDCKNDIAKIKKIINKPSILFTVESYEEKGELFAQQLVSADSIRKGVRYLPIKKDKRLSDIGKYGGYKKIKIAYFFIVEYTKGKKKIVQIQNVPIYISKDIRDGKITLEDYCKDVLELENFKIIIPKILIKTSVNINNFEYTLNGKSDDKIIIKPIEQAFWSINNTKLHKNLYKANNEKDQIGLDHVDINEIKKGLKLTIDKIGNSPFNNRRNIPEIVREFDIENNNLSKEELLILYVELQKFIKSTLETSDIRIIGGAENRGKILLNNKLRNNKWSVNRFELIYRSITGIYEKRVKLI